MPDLSSPKEGCNKASEMRGWTVEQLRDFALSTHNLGLREAARWLLSYSHGHKEWTAKRFRIPWDGISVVDFMVQCGAVKTRNEARRLLKQGSVRTVLTWVSGRPEIQLHENSVISTQDWDLIEIGKHGYIAESIPTLKWRVKMLYCRVAWWVQDFVELMAMPGEASPWWTMGPDRRALWR